ncbi:phosphate ABC transporter substrate-binding protein PstS [Microcoleus sp. FACHB-SPT15]|uniref:phosphate ABC transporter substrate-binding protein PstS n=1 Tax=Microcoleus sp. FACHB-SPT15 TaxID=2692830 RepID=UPI001782E315|nr:phosphate ABC transporter substrate-binding protein PstS [Microcoleus sp. FACHB-SPT15]MBD1807507.1 phosphate ABC transporter substrate-binding protein PstS [Microcoleus sp. FACHB-SPT15]
MFLYSHLFNPTRILTSISVVALSAGLVACGQQEASSPNADGGKLALNENVSLVGAGASFPTPLYQRWFQEINQDYPNLRINYQSVGSGAGVEQFTTGTVDFGASDVAMTDEEIQKVERGVLLLPMAAGSIVLTYNLPNVESGLKLPREVYTGILQGQIKSWNNPAIAQANPGVQLPNQPITVVHRSDGSGTTGVFTKHLSAISPEWKNQVGEGKTVDWPAGVGAKGNEGVTAQVKQTPGAIGYVEYGYAKQNNLPVAALENQSGNFIVPSEESASKTLEAVELPANFRAFISDPNGAESYPIVTYTWLLAYENYPDASKAKSMEAMIEYGLTEGQRYSAELGYVPLPPSVVEKVAAAADKLSPDYNITVDKAAASKF